MKKLPLWAMFALLPACQMTLPTGPGPAPVSDGVTAAPAEAATETAPADTAEARLAAAFVAAAQGAESDEKKGFFAFLTPKSAASPLADTGIEVVAGTAPGNAMTALASGEETPSAENQSDAADVVPGTQITADTTELRQAGLGGLFGFLKPKAKQTTRLAALPVTPDSSDAQEGASAVRPETFGVATEIPTLPEAVAPARKPLFGFLKSGPRKSGPVSTVARGVTLPFGEVGIFCEAKKRDLGRLVDQFPRKGRALWHLYDTDPESTGPRTQFLTGFADGCPRQVTAALVMFGEAGLHEVLRYSKGNDSAWSEADKGYEKIKRKACGVGRKVRCPDEKVGSLQNHLAFVSVYPRFGAESGWLELLLHDGAVMSEEIR